MPFSNAFVDPPLLPTPNPYRISIHSRSESRSPVRHYARDFDPLLRDLSPTATLRAFMTDPNDNSVSDAIADSVRTSSMGERALGAKAAQACLDLRTWAQEIEAWEWPGTFDIPEPARKKARLSTMTFNSVFSGNTIASTDDDPEEEHWGSLPARSVRQYEERADEIRQRLDDMNVEELKEYVLATHYRVDPRLPSREGSFDAIGETSDWKPLDDFTALVTATILQSLPYLSKLHRLLDIWTLRLTTLRNASGFLQDLRRARTDLDHGWAAIAVSSVSDSHHSHANFDRQTMVEMKTLIEKQVGSLGRRLDRFLDDLEGREETVPDTWIDDFELLETAYGSWVVQAERKVLENEWRQGNHSPGSNAEQRTSNLMYDKSSSEIASEPEALESISDTTLQPSNSLSDDFQIASSTGVSRPTRSTVVNAKSNQVRVPDGDFDSMSIPKIVTRNSAELTELSDSGVISAVSSRERTPSPDPSSLDQQSQVARRRAAFLGEIERNNSLMKQSKSPVRPFEHASNAFTRLFKKDRSPEKIRAKRPTSSKLSSTNSSDDISSSVERKPLSAVSSASSRFNTFGMGDAASSAPALIQDSIDATPETGSSPKGSTDVEIDTQRDAKGAHGLSTRRVKDLRHLQMAAATKDSPPNYQRTGLSSPFHSPSGAGPPDDWPLSSPGESTFEGQPVGEESQKPVTSLNGEGSDDELHTPAAAMQSDTFDQIFIQSFPSRPEERPGSARASARSVIGFANSKRATSLPRSFRRVMSRTDMPSMPTDHMDIVSSVQPRASSQSPGPQSRGHVDVQALNKVAPRADTSLLSPTYSDSVETTMRALLAPIPNGPVEIPASGGSPELTQRVYSSLHQASFPQDDPPEDIEYERPNAIKRASMTSIELFSRTQLKSIDVPKSSRQSSVSSRTTPPQTPKESSHSASTVPTGDISKLDSTLMNYKGLVTFPTPPKNGDSPGVASSPLGGDDRYIPRRERNNENDGLQSSPVAESASPNHASLNVAVKKRRGKSGLSMENQLPSTINPVASPSKRTAPLKSDEDYFDRHVSEVLETLPSDIRFKPRAGAETPGPRAGYAAPRPRMAHTRRTSRDHSITIAPAESSPKKSSQASDPEVKLYHLTQAGRDEPIKLFVRLVGEGERVMVRVGGGWADLADYLRQYAEHHGSRTVSEGGVEVQTMPNAPTRMASGPIEFRAKTPVTPRPDSSDSDKEWPDRQSGGFPFESGSIAAVNERGGETSITTTPNSTYTSSRPSTATVSRPPSRQNTGEIGLAGPPSGKKNGLSDHKAKWVEGMIERAKQASAEKSREDNQKYFGELGRAGGTRRVIFRSSSGVGEKTK